MPSTCSNARSRPRTAAGTRRRRARPGSGAGRSGRPAGRALGRRQRSHPRSAPSASAVGRGSATVASRVDAGARSSAASVAARCSANAATAPLAAGLAQVAQRGGGEVVVGVRERGPAGVGERVDPGRAAPAALRRTGRGSRSASSAVGDQRVEVAADRGGREPEPLGERGRALRAALEDQPGDRVAGAVGPPAPRRLPRFHNTSMTYFRRRPHRRRHLRYFATATAPSAGRQTVGCRACSTAPLELTARAGAAGRLPARRSPGSSTCRATGPVILAGNHISFADEFFTPLAARRQVVYFAKAEYFTTPGCAGGLMAGVLHASLGPRAGRARRHPRRPRASSTSASSVLAPGQGARHLPRGHPLARRPAAQVPHRRRPAGAAQRGAGRPGRAGRHARGAAARRAGAGTARRSRSTSARRCTSATAPARSAARGCCARSPRPSATRCRQLSRPGLRRQSTPSRPAAKRVGPAARRCRRRGRRRRAFLDWQRVRCCRACRRGRRPRQGATARAAPWTACR